MERLGLPSALRGRVDAWRLQGLRVGLVPTMGNLHAGHLALVARARELCERVVASVFVNPTQFGPGEDFDRYPRTLEDDAEALAGAGCDLLYAPDIAAIYPAGPAQSYKVVVPALAGVLCGAHRPGHFDGVATVVTRLYNQVRPDLAVFGEKDFQQLRILERLTVDLGYGIAIARGATVREPDGLAMSSRNRYLAPGERARAPALREALLTLREGWRAGIGLAPLEAAGRRSLADAGFEVDYLEVRDEDALERPGPGRAGPFRVFAAARLGATRLLDNLPLGDHEGQ
ncbi:MAG: pantoate--beta-alanine ligase [Xanthomonadales bacterium]|nr:pantoate--beta-alanine ligase [Xanthomonadales bacterium]